MRLRLRSDSLVPPSQCSLKLGSSGSSAVVTAWRQSKELTGLPLPLLTPGGHEEKRTGSFLPTLWRSVLGMRTDSQASELF